MLPNFSSSTYEKESGRERKEEDLTLPSSNPLAFRLGLQI